jgi:hypothetical protein
MIMMLMLELEPYDQDIIATVCFILVVILSIIVLVNDRRDVE